MMKLALIALATAFALGAPVDANAQVKKRDHRAKQPETRDHRAKKKRKPRPDKGPAVRDHRKKKPTVRDSAKGPVIRDHRDKVKTTVGKAGIDAKVKVVIDPNRKPGTLVRDHRKNKVDRKSRRAEYRVRAKARWKTRRAELAKKEAERRANYERRREERIASRAARRQKRRAAIRAAWEAKFLADAQVQTELELHGRRVARINRLRRLAEIKDRGKLVIRIEIVAQYEDDRHAERLDVLSAELKAK